MDLFEYPLPGSKLYILEIVFLLAKVVNLCTPEEIPVMLIALT